MEDSQVREYLEAGLCVLPCKMPEKKPKVESWTQFQKLRPTPGQHQINGAMGIVTGEVSENLFVLDLDLKYDLTGILLERLESEIGAELWDRIFQAAYIQKTINNGLHIFLRCEQIESSMKLAQRPATKEELEKSSHDKVRVLLETRGEGGFIVCAPTPGYAVVSGSLLEIGFISIEDKERLFEVCRSFNEVFTEIKPPTSKKFTNDFKDLTPWEDYNQKVSGGDYILSQSWTYLKTVGADQHYCRAGKKGTTSGTWNQSLGLFHCFTTSSQLEGDKSYSPFALFTFMECNGDFAEAAKRLYSLGYGERITNDRANASGIKISDWRALQIVSEPAEQTPLLTIGRAPIATAGNYSLVIGKKKSRKTLFLTWLVSQYDGNSANDFLLFDTEQGTRHVWKVMDRIKQLTGKSIGVFYLRGKSPAERKSIIETVVLEYSTRPKVVIIDGIRDLLSNINDPDQVSDLLTWLEKLTLDQNLHVVNVLHQNKTDNNARGHLGSELLNKSEITIELERDEKADCTIVKCESSRDIPFESFAFRHNEKGLPEIVGLPTGGKVLPEDEKKSRLRFVFTDLGILLAYSDLTEGIKQHFNVGVSKAKGMVAEFNRNGWIVKSGIERSKNVVYKCMI